MTLRLLYSRIGVRHPDRCFLTASLPIVCLSLFLSVASADAGELNAAGIRLPPDAAPLSQQRLRLFEIDGPYMEWFKTIYKRAPAFDLIGEPLVRMNKNNELEPGAALTWEATPDGYGWLFHLRPGMVWTDGQPFNAHDYVFSLRRGADPKNAYDFEWYYRSIKNWGAVVGHRLPLDSLGVTAIDDLTLLVRTEQPIPYLPYNLAASWPSPQQMVDKYGDEWSTRTETIVSCGPYELDDWKKNEGMTLRLNKTYRGSRTPYLQEMAYKLYSQAGQPPMMPAYESGEVDMVPIGGQAALGRVRSDPVRSRELHSSVAMVTYYLAMDTYNSVFKDVRVRQAFARAIDRNALMNSALKDLAMPAYSMLPPGFPGANPDAFKDTFRYDPSLARTLLAEAGYPGGKGFPNVEIWIRGRDSGDMVTAAEGIQAMMKQNLGISVGIRVIEMKVFTNSMNSHTVTIALVPYSMDYPDPSNLLGLWFSTGRHPWKNDRFEQLVRQANEFMGAPSERFKIYEEAERLLVEDVGGVFLWHPVQHWVWRSSFHSEDLTANRGGMELWSNNAISSGYFVRSDSAGAPPIGLFQRLLAWLMLLFSR